MSMNKNNKVPRKVYRPTSATVSAQLKQNKAGTISHNELPSNGTPSTSSGLPKSSLQYKVDRKLAPDSKLVKLKTQNGNETSNSTTKMPTKLRTSIAASYLGKTADGLGSSPKKSGNLAHSDHIKSEDCRVTVAKQTVTQKKGKNNCDSLTPKKGVPFHVTPEKQADRQLLRAVDRNFASSPTVKKIPNDIVRQRVISIQKPPVSPKGVRDGEQLKQIGQIRKSLAGVFKQQGKRKSITGSRSSYLPGLEEEVDVENFSVTVAVRVRPFSQRETGLKAKQVVFMNGNETVVTDGSAEHSFVYDYSFSSFDKDGDNYTSQRTVYEKLGKPLLCASFDGYNTCLFAYGQTGSGKSYTIMGLGEDKGVVPRFCDEMFASIQTKEHKEKNVRYHVQVSYFEIYNEKIHDLLVSSTTTSEGEAVKQILKVREHPESGPYVEGLSKFIVSSYEDVQQWIEVGNRQRATAATGMNDKSSRSHSVFTINVVQTTTEVLDGENHESNRRSRINLVDLAGSERSSTAGTSGQRLKEGASINKSLLTLGKVISTLSERSELKQKRRKRLFVPYRDSTLTWILKESLGGNSRTAMIATISPASCHMEETLSTLRYAKQARSIVNLVKINEDPNARIIKELKAEIAKLKEAHGQNGVDPSEFKASLLEVSTLKKRLCSAEQEKDEVQAAWKKKLEQSEKRKAEEIMELKRAGVSFKVDNQLPNLVNLNEDPQLSELLLYVIKHGVTRVGKKGSDCDIQLNGALIADLHCIISNVDEIVKVEPVGEAKTFLNGELVQKTEVLHHGDRVIIGGDHFFRLNNPIEVHREGRKRNSGGKRKDFEFAKLELVERQNERLQMEIEEAQLQVKKEMLGEIEAAKHEAEQQISSQKSEYEKEIQNLQAQLVKDQATKRDLETICEQAEVLNKERKINWTKRKLEPPAGEQEEYVLDVVAGEESRANPLSYLFQQLSVRSADIKIQVLAGLEAERQKLTEEVKRMQMKRERAKKNADQDESTNANSLRLSLLLQEANNISKTLNKRTLFSRHDTSDDQSSVMIRLHNTKLGIWTFWSLEKFEEKLEVMREVYNGSCTEDEGDVTSLFYDPNDAWEDAYSPSQDAPTSCNNKDTTRRLSRRLSSLVLARASPALKQSLTRLNTEGHTPGSRCAAVDCFAHIDFCKRRLASALKTTSEGLDSLMDKFLLALHQLNGQSQKIAQSFKDKEDYSSSVNFYEDSFTMTTSCENLLSIVGFIKCNSVQFIDSSRSLSKLLYQLEKAVKDLFGFVTKLLHGCQSGIENIVAESSSKISRTIPNISKYGGAITIATNLTVSLFSEDQQRLLSHRLKHAFLQGGDTFMRKVLSGGIERLAEVEKENVVHDKSGNIGGLCGSAIQLLKMCMELQESLHAEIIKDVLNTRISESMQELYNASLVIQERNVPPHYYSEYLHRTQTLIVEISTLVDGVAQLNTKTCEFISNSVSSDQLHYKAESLWRPTSRIADLCVKHEGLCAIMHDLETTRQTDVESNLNSNNSNNRDDCSETIPSDSLCDQVFSAARKLQEALRDIIDFADQGSLQEGQDVDVSDLPHLKSSSSFNISDRKSSKRKRILPSSPPLLNSDAFSTSSAVRNVAGRWLDFADYTIDACSTKANDSTSMFI